MWPLPYIHSLIGILNLKMRLSAENQAEFKTNSPRSQIRIEVRPQYHSTITIFLSCFRAYIPSFISFAYLRKQ